jgi:hypothetical protein
VKRAVTCTRTDSPFRLSVGSCLGACRDAMVVVVWYVGYSGVQLSQVRCRRVRRINMTFAIRVKSECSMGCLAAVIDSSCSGGWRGIALARAMAGIWGKVASATFEMTHRRLDSRTITLRRDSQRVAIRLRLPRNPSNPRIQHYNVRLRPHNAGPMTADGVTHASDPQFAEPNIITRKGANTRTFHGE